MSEKYVLQREKTIISYVILPAEDLKREEFTFLISTEVPLRGYDIRTVFDFAKPLEKNIFRKAGSAVGKEHNIKEYDGES